MSQRIEWRRGGVPLLLVATTALLALGLTLPALYLDKPLSSREHSIIGGAFNLLTGGWPLVGVVILAFSVVFPLIKLVVLTLIWSQSVDDERHKIHWLGVLGKWSMLDIYVVAIFVGAVRLGLLAEFEARRGIYFFGASILVAMVTTHVIQYTRGLRQSVNRKDVRLGKPGYRALSLVSIAAFAAGISLPLMEVEKWVFWSNEESVLGALGTLFAEGQQALGLLLTVFVLLLPAAQLLGIACVRWFPRLSDRALHWLLFIEEWAMLDVFALALLVTVAQLGGMASIVPRPGMGLILFAAATSWFDSWRLRTALRASRG